MPELPDGERPGQPARIGTYRIERRLARLASWSGQTPETIRAAIWGSGFEDDAERGLLSADDYDSLLETIEVLGDQELMEAIREGEAALARGDVYTRGQVEEELKALGRWPRDL